MPRTFGTSYNSFASLVVLFSLISPCWSEPSELFSEDFDALFDILEPAEDEGIDPARFGQHGAGTARR